VSEGWLSAVHLTFIWEVFAMKNKRILAGVIVIFLGGCVPSLHELYTEDTLVFEEKLLGQWTHDKEIWNFEKATEDKVYNLVITQEEDDKSVLVGHLVKIDDDLFLDLYPGDMELDVGDFYKMHLLPAHTFVKVDAIEPELTIRAMNPEALEQMLKEKPKLIKHEIIDDRLVLTASPKELQAFLKAHADYEDFFGDALELSRYVPTGPNEADTAGGGSKEKN
jgi:hypothetical protein